MHLLIDHEDSLTLGQNAADVAAQALEDLGREMIRQKALSIGRQIEIYLGCANQSQVTIEQLKADKTLASIAVQPVGLTGYSAVHDTHGINIFHSNPAVVGSNLRDRAKNIPQFWDIIARSLDGEADGYYDWEDGHGKMRSKYMYCNLIRPRQIAPLGLVVAATTFIDEFLRPSRDIRQKILTLAGRADEYMRAEMQRNRELRSINEISRKISSILSLDSLLPSVVEMIQKGFQYDCVQIYLLEDHGISLSLNAQAGIGSLGFETQVEPVQVQAFLRQVMKTGKPFWIDNAISEKTDPINLADSEPCSRLIAPIKIGSEMLGLLVVMRQRPQTFSELDVFILQPLADQLAIAIENARLTTELREMAVLEERNRIAREIHDTLAQGFAGLSMNMETAKQALQMGDLAGVEEQLDLTRQLAREKLNEARRSVMSLHPKLDLLEEIEELIQGELEKISQSHQYRTQFQVIGERRPLHTDIKMAVYRISQEALTNIRKHAQASAITILLAYTDHGVELSIQDDGVGFDPQRENRSSFGLVCMRERARLLGGALHVETHAGKGTLVKVSMPC